MCCTFMPVQRIVLLIKVKIANSKHFQAYLFKI
jgi:hypothetical protein